MLTIYDPSLARIAMGSRAAASFNGTEAESPRKGYRHLFAREKGACLRTPHPDGHLRHRRRSRATSAARSASSFVGTAIGDGTKGATARLGKTGSDGGVRRTVSGTTTTGAVGPT